MRLPLDGRATWVRWLVRTYVGLGIIVIGCLMMAIDPVEDVGVYVTIFGLVWFALAYLMSTPVMPDDDE